MAERSRLGALAVERGFVTAEELNEALRTQNELSGEDSDKPVGDILVEKGYLRPNQLEALLQIQEEAGKSRIGPYQILDRLGGGGMGSVYKARDERTGQVVALKTLKRQLALDPAFVRRFEREGRLGLKLDDPNVVRTLDVGEGVGPWNVNYRYVALEYVEGTNVEKLLEERGRILECGALEITLSVARALAHAQDTGLIHRDIKPSNILLAADGRTLLADLGLARSTIEETTRFTVTGMALGSPHYISPEQARGSKDIDCRSDIYSLGATLYHMLTGEAPFQGGSPAIVISRRLTNDLPSPRDIVPELSEAVCLLVEKMMAKKRRHRHPHPAMLVEETEKVLAGENPCAPLRAGLSNVCPPPRRPEGPGVRTGARRRARTVHAAPVGAGRRRRMSVQVPMAVGAGFLVGAVGVAFGLLLGTRGTNVPLWRRPQARPAPEEHERAEWPVKVVARTKIPDHARVLYREDFDKGPGGWHSTRGSGPGERPAVVELQRGRGGVLRLSDRASIEFIPKALEARDPVFSFVYRTEGEASGVGLRILVRPICGAPVTASCELPASREWTGYGIKLAPGPGETKPGCSGVFELELCCRGTQGRCVGYVDDFVVYEVEEAAAAATVGGE